MSDFQPESPIADVDWMRHQSAVNYARNCYYDAFGNARIDQLSQSEQEGARAFMQRVYDRAISSFELPEAAPELPESPPSILAKDVQISLVHKEMEVTK